MKRLKDNVKEIEATNLIIAVSAQPLERLRGPVKWFKFRHYSVVAFNTKQLQSFQAKQSVIPI